MGDGRGQGGCACAAARPELVLMVKGRGPGGSGILRCRQAFRPRPETDSFLTVQVPLAQRPEPAASGAAGCRRRGAQALVVWKGRGQVGQGAGFSAAARLSGRAPRLIPS